MASHVDKMDAEVKKAMAEIKKLSLVLKKGPNPAATKQIRDLMVKYNRANLIKAYTAAATKDAEYLHNEINKFVL